RVWGPGRRPLFPWGRWSGFSSEPPPARPIGSGGALRRIWLEGFFLCAGWNASREFMSRAGSTLKKLPERRPSAPVLGALGVLAAFLFAYPAGAAAAPAGTLVGT